MRKAYLCFVRGALTSGFHPNGVTSLLFKFLQMQASRYSRSHRSELDIDGVELLPSDNESPNMVPIISREQLPPPSHAQDLPTSVEVQHNQHNQYTETPSVHASGLSPEYAAYPPHSSPINYEVSQDATKILPLQLEG